MPSDGGDDLTHLARRLRNGLHHRADLGHGFAAAARQLGAAFAFLLHLLRGFCRLAHRTGQFLHCRRGFLQAAGLRFGALGQILRALRDLGRNAAKAADFLARIAHHRAQVEVNALHALKQLFDRAIAGRFLLRVGQVAPGNVGHQSRCGGQGRGDAPLTPPQCEGREGYQRHRLDSNQLHGCCPAEKPREQSHRQKQQQKPEQAMRRVKALELAQRVAPAWAPTHPAASQQPQRAGRGGGGGGVIGVGGGAGAALQCVITPLLSVVDMSSSWLG